MAVYVNLWNFFLKRWQQTFMVDVQTLIQEHQPQPLLQQESLPLLWRSSELFFGYNNFIHKLLRRILFKVRAITCKNYLLKIYPQHANFLNAI